jgi:hypothetical protein
VALINFPLILKENIVASVLAFGRSLSALRTLIFGENFQAYEKQGSVMVSAACLHCAEVFQATEPKRQEVVQVIDLINAMYISFYEGADQQVVNPEISRNLDLIVNMSISYLSEIAFTAKQQRAVNLLVESNAINLSMKYYGEGDTKLEEFINDNKLSLNEYFIIEPGRKIVYYV